MTRPDRSDTAVDLALAVEGLCVEVRGERRQSKRILHDVNMNVGRGERMVVIGPSGCGKTTLLNAMAGFAPSSSGRISVGGREVRGPGRDRIVVFQDFGQLFPWKTARSNVEFALRRRSNRLGRSQRRSEALKFLDMVGLAPQADQYQHTLSGGQKQRVALARSLAAEPDVLLMDEPFGALDAISRERMQKLVLELWSETRSTIVFVTHDVNEAALIGHRVAVMADQPGTVQQILENPAADKNDDAATHDFADKLRDSMSVEPGGQS